MAGRIIGLVSSLLCALPFFIIATYEKNSEEPINFWSGDATLKAKVKNVRDYNREMSKLYKMYALTLLIAGIGFLLMPTIGIAMLSLDFTVGIYLVYRKYKKILERCS